MKREDALFDFSVRFGDAGMLSQMFSPRFNHEGFNKAARIGRITMQTPAVRAISSSHSSHFTHDATKLLRALRIDTVFDRNEHWSFIRLWLNHNHRFRPMHPRRQTQIFKPDQSISHADKQTQD